MDSKIKNVVFDLGGVLINLDFDNCLNAFRKAGFQDIEKQACQFRGKGFFSQFELGEISPEEFRKAIRKEVSEALSDHEIDDMWNLMLLDIPREKLDLLLKLREHYMVYLLSNTNRIPYNVRVTLAISPVFHEEYQVASGSTYHQFHGRTGLR